MKTLSEQIVFTGKIFAVVQQQVDLGNGKVKTFEVAKRPPSVRGIFRNPEGKILLSKERRKEIEAEDLRLPGGKVCDTRQEYESVLDLNEEERFERIQATFVKESEEEVGLIPRSYELFRRSRIGATVERDLRYFVCEDFTVTDQRPEDGEKITFARYTPAQVKEYCLSGVMSEERSVAVLLQYLSLSS